MPHHCPKCGFTFEDPPAAAPPDEAGALCAQAEAALAKGLPREALALYERAAGLDRDRTNPLIAAGLAACHLYLGDFTRALAEADRACGLSPTIRSFEVRGIALCALGRHEEAAPVLDEVLNMDPAHPSAHYYRGQVFETLGGLKEALAHYERALEAQPGLTEALWAKAGILETLKRPQEALAAYARLARNPLPDHGIYLRMAACARALNDFPNEAEQLRRFLEKPPPGSEQAIQEARRRLSLAAVHDKVSLAKSGGNPAALAAALEELLAFSPEDREVRKQLQEAKFLALADEAGVLCAQADAAMAKSRSSDAQGLYERAASLDPGRTNPRIAAGLAACSYFFQGQVIETQGGVEEALTHYERALEAQPRFPEALGAKAKALETLRQRLSPAAAPEKAPVAGPREDPAPAMPEEAGVLCAQAEAVLAKGLPREALALYERAAGLDRERTNPLIAAGLAACHLHLGDFARALVEADRACVLSPTIRSFEVRGIALFALGRHEEAAPVLDEVLKMDPRHPSAHYYRGQVFEAQDRLDEALAHYEQALESQPGFPEALWAKAGALEALQRPQEALAAYSRLAQGPLPNHGIYLRMAACARALNDFPSEAGHLRRFLEMPPPGSEQAVQEARERLSLAAVQEKVSLARSGENPAELVAALEELLAFSPEDREVRKQLQEAKGLALAGAENFIEAASCLEGLVQRHPVRIEVWRAFAKCLQSLGKPDRLRRFCEETLKSDPKHAEALFHAAMEEKNRDAKKAIPLFQRFLESASDDTPDLMRSQARKSLWVLEHPDLPLRPAQAQEWIQRGDQLSMVGNLTDAFNCYNKALEEDPTSGRGWTNKGSMLLYLSRLPEALECLIRACEFEPGDVSNWKKRADVLERLGRKHDARECWRKAKAIAPHDPEIARKLS